ncbi:MAG TPA: UDP-N-acetylmuramate dehydrogenase [Bacteroidales bacterium]|nr:UDP-N-acetylmuramate dehydrogenase [Bacteroidales bacterium]
MVIQNDISLKKYNTFRLDYRADRIIIPESETDIKKISLNLPDYSPFLILGGGSNLLFVSDFKGTIINPMIKGIRIEKSDEYSAIVSAGAGVVWDSLVEWAVEEGLYGIENLSLIPGNVGASPVQNIGAYGTEVKQTIEKVEAIRLSDGAQVFFSNSECGFSYRYSIFKGPEKGKYIVTRVHYRLSRKPAVNLDYGSVKEEVAKLGNESLANIRLAVKNIRRRKLPDPDYVGNAGSFFKNPVVNDSIANELKIRYPSIPVYPGKKGFTKIAAGWLIEQAGFKGFRDGDAGVHDKQALVIINYGKATGKEIYFLSESIKTSVKERFGIVLEREVEIAGSI